jgi:hypothetical protein
MSKIISLAFICLTTLFMNSPAFAGRLVLVFNNMVSQGGGIYLRSVVFDVQTADSWTCTFEYRTETGGRCTKNKYNLNMPQGTYAVAGGVPPSQSLPSFITVEEASRIITGCVSASPTWSCASISLPPN